MEGSWEWLMHATETGDQLLLMDRIEREPLFREPIPQRAIGVVYHPRYEHTGNYVASVMPQRYDAFIHIDHSRGLHPMEVYIDKKQLPETYSWAF